MHCQPPSCVALLFDFCISISCSRWISGSPMFVYLFTLSCLKIAQHSVEQINWFIWGDTNSQKKSLACSISRSFPKISSPSTGFVSKTSCHPRIYSSSSLAPLLHLCIKFVLPNALSLVLTFKAGNDDFSFGEDQPTFLHDYTESGALFLLKFLPI